MLDSLVSQTRPPDEVIFVDDNSPDGTRGILEQFIATHPWPAGGRLKLLVNDRNIGQAASLNRGISVASSELIMILNDDDYLMHDAVQSMLTYFGDYRDVALIGSTNVGISGPNAMTDQPRISTAYAAPGLPLRRQLPEDVLGYRHPNDLNMTHSASCFLKSAWQAVGGYRSVKKQRVVPYADRDFQLRMNAVFAVAVAAETPYVFWRSDSSVDNGVDS
jgi:glycosyltransferase involved in cell wall biosynthesis